MADDDEREEVQESSGRSKEERQAFDKVTDNYEGQELDVSKAQQNLTKLFQQEKKTKQEKQKREAELAAVAIKSEDVDVITEEFEIARPLAERTLREHKGDLSSALKFLITS